MPDSQPIMYMTDGESPWASLGKSMGLENVEEKISKAVDDIKKEMYTIQGELIGTIEAQEKRIRELEERLDKGPVRSALDVMSVDELNEITGANIGSEWDKLDYSEGEIIDVEGDVDVHEKPEMSGVEKSALEINDWIDQNYGITNMAFKKNGLIPQDADKEYREQVHNLLMDKYEVDVWKKSAGMWFYFRRGKNAEDEYKRSFNGA